MDGSLKCNYPKCKVAISGIGCVTRCSHIFCEQHKIAEEGMNRLCPACGSALEGLYSVILREVNPSEEWKAGALLGYPPEMIFEAMSKALLFWQLQMNAELMARKKGNEHWKQRLAQRESTLEAMQLKINQYIQMQTQKVDYYKNEVRSLTETINELQGIIDGKTRELINLQARFESLCRQSTASILATVEPMDLEMETFDQGKYRNIRRNPAPPTPQFLFKPTISSPPSNFSCSQSTPRRVPIEKPMETSCSQRTNGLYQRT